MKHIASPTLRLISGTIDWLIGMLVVTLALYWISSATTLTQLLDQTLIGLIFVIAEMWFVFPVVFIFMLVQLGGTPGKLITGIRVVDKNGKYPGLKQAFFRNWIGYMVSGMMLWLGFIWILIDSGHRGWHDMIADTWVIVKQKQGLLFGGIVLAGLMLVHLYLVGISIKQFEENVPLYQQTVEDVKKDFESTMKEFSSPSPNSMNRGSSMKY